MRTIYSLMQKIRENPNTLHIEGDAISLPDYTLPESEIINANHKSSIRAIQVLPNNQIASSSEDGELHIRDLVSKKINLLFTLHNDFFIQLSITQDKKKLVGLAYKKKEIYIICLETLQINCFALNTHHTLPVRAISIISESSFITSGRDLTMQIWDLNDGHHIKTLLDPMHGFSEIMHFINTLITLPNNKLAAAGQDGVIRIFDLSSDKLDFILKGHTGPINKLILLNNGWLASVSDDKSIRLWSIEDKNCISVLKGHTEYIFSLVELDNETLASGSRDHTICIWNIYTGACLSTLIEHKNPIQALALLSDGSLISGSGPFFNLFGKTSDNSLRLWKFPNVRTITCKDIKPILSTLKGSLSIKNLSIVNCNLSDDDIAYEIIPALRKNKFIETLDLSNNQITDVGAKILSTLFHNNLNLYTIKLDDNSVSSSTEEQLHKKLSEKYLKLGHCKLNKMISNNVLVLPELMEDYYESTSMSLEDKGTYILGVMGDNYIIIEGLQNNIQIIDIHSNHCVATLVGHQERVLSVLVFSNECLITSSTDKTIQIWSLFDKCSKQLVLTNDVAVRTLTKINENHFVSGSYNGAIQFWKIELGLELTCTLIKQFNVHEGNVINIVALNEFNLLASADRNGNILLWDIHDVNNIDCVGTLYHNEEINRIEGLSYGYLAVCGVNQHEISIYNVFNQNNRALLFGHRGTAVVVRKLNDGLLASGAADKKIIIWELNLKPIVPTVLEKIDDLASIKLKKVTSSAEELDKFYNHIDLLSLDYSIVKKLKGHNDVIFSIEQFPDGTIVSSTVPGILHGISYVMFGPNDATVRIWKSHLRVLKFDDLHKLLQTQKYENIHTLHLDNITILESDIDKLLFWINKRNIRKVSLCNTSLNDETVKKIIEWKREEINIKQVKFVLDDNPCLSQDLIDELQELDKLPADIIPCQKDSVRLHGKDTVIDINNKVTVYIWLPWVWQSVTGKAIGHVSLRTYGRNETYVSLWPSVDKEKTQFFQARGQVFHKALAEDIKSENNREPDYEFSFYSLSAKEIKEKFYEFRYAHPKLQWSLLGSSFLTNKNLHNCCSIILYLLKVAGIGELLATNRSMIQQIGEEIGIISQAVAPLVKVGAFFISPALADKIPTIDVTTEQGRTYGKWLGWLLGATFDINEMIAISPRNMLSILKIAKKAEEEGEPYQSLIFKAFNSLPDYSTIKSYLNNSLNFTSSSVLTRSINISVDLTNQCFLKVLEKFPTEMETIQFNPNTYVLVRNEKTETGWKLFYYEDKNQKEKQDIDIEQVPSLRELLSNNLPNDVITQIENLIVLYHKRVSKDEIQMKHGFFEL